MKHPEIWWRRGGFLVIGEEMMACLGRCSLLRWVSSCWTVPENIDPGLIAHQWQASVGKKGTDSKQKNHQNSKTYKFSHAMPLLRILQWPPNTHSMKPQHGTRLCKQLSSRCCSFPYLVIQANCHSLLPLGLCSHIPYLPSNFWVSICLSRLDSSVIQSSLSEGILSLPGRATDHHPPSLHSSTSYHFV